MSITIRSMILPRGGYTLTYELERKPVKRLNLRIRRDGTVHLSIPTRTTIAYAEEFLRTREEWILSALARVKERALQNPLSEEIGDSLPYLGETLTIAWRSGEKNRLEADIENRRLTITLPDVTDLQGRAAAIDAFQKAETTRLVTELVARYHPIFAARGVPYPASIRVKHIKSRFGSCAPRNRSLNFAARLCRYPLPFVEYVVVHELCHFLEANHSDRFWAEVERVMPDWRAREKMR